MIDPAFGHWFAGFTDGEGCFLINKQRRNYTCQFTIQLRIDDEPILRQVRDQLGIGNVTYSYGRTGSNRTSKPRAIFHVSSKNGCAELRNVFLIHSLRAKKIEDFKIWSEALDFWLLYKRGDDWSFMKDAKERLQTGRVFKEEYERVAQLQAEE